MKIGQALIYPLTVASKSSVPGRKMAANKILTKMKEHSESLVNQAIMVSDEQIRIAILWHEQWHEALEEASRLFFGERQVSLVKYWFLPWLSAVLRILVGFNADPDPKPAF